MVSMVVNEPLLLIAFNRPREFERLIERLRTFEPQIVYVAVDGPRSDYPDDRRNIEETKALVQSIDWTRGVRLLAQETNLGCGLGVSTALNWFFKHEERGVILEDDILPRESFFGFCSELLDRYEEDERVLAISGCNFVPPEAQTWPDLPYRFSRVPHIWGWASWRRSWALYNLDMTNWSNRLGLRRLWNVSGRSVQGMIYWRSLFNLMARSQIDTWDLQFVFEGLVREMYTATSNVNLVDNIGFGIDATHTEVRPWYLRSSEEIALPLAEVPVTVDEKAEVWSRTNVFAATPGGIAEQWCRYLRRRVEQGKG